MTPCPRCVQLPSRGGWGFEQDVPAGYHELVREGGWSFCPDCGLAYRLGYEEEWDIVTCDQSWTLARLTPREAASELEGPRREAAREARPGWAAAAREWVEAGTEAARRLAVWILVDEATAGDAPVEVDALLAHADPIVSGAALHELRVRARDGGAVCAATGALEAALGHPDAQARRDAAAVLTRRLRDHGPAALAPLLGSGDPVVLLAFVGELRYLMHAGDDIADLLPALEPLRKHGDEDVRDHVAWAIAAAPASPEGKAIQERQAGELGGLLTNRQRSFEAQCRLRDVIQAGVDVTALLPEFFRALVAAPPITGDYQRVLRAIRDKKIDVTEHLGEIVRAVADPRPNVDYEAMYLLEELVEGGADISPHRRAILPHVGRLDGYKAERIGRFLGRGLLERGDLDAG